MHFFITSLTALIFPFRHLSLHSRVHDGYQGEEEDLVGGGGEADQVDQDHDQEGGGDGGHGGRVDLEQYVNKKDIQPKMFRDVQTKNTQRNSNQRYSKIFKPPGGMPGTPSRQVCFPLHSCTHLVRGGYY